MYLQNRKIFLTKSEYEICEFLAVNRGSVFSKEQIYEKIFGYEGEGDSSSITTHIKNIRQKLTLKKCPIQTIWGVGYLWEKDN
nr:winged helix-turn-helix domain-containing protein [Bombilactobacillus bombi]